jgi:hypothetical protein
VSLRDAAARAAVLGALHDAIGVELKTVKAEVLAGLKEASRETGTRQIDASLPDGPTVAKISLVTPDAAATVVDEGAFKAWVLANRPDQIRREFVTSVREAFVKSLLAEMTAARVTQWCDAETGEVHDVPGVKLQPRATYHRTAWAKTGKSDIAAAWAAGDLLGLTLPQLTAGDDQ